MALSCEELHEQITAYVDDRIDEEEYRRDVERHIEACPSCRSAFEEEVAVKMVVRKRFPHVSTPDTVRTSVEESIEALARSSPGKARYARRTSSGGSKFPIVMLLLIVTALAGYILLFEDSDDPQTEPPAQAEQTSRTRQITPSSRPSTGPANCFNLAMINFGKIESGELQVQHTTNDLTALRTTFEESGVSGLRFPGVSLPLKGGIVADRNGSKFAQLVYEGGGTLLYVFEVPWDALQNGDAVYVTTDVTEKLQAGEAIWQRPDAKSNLVMYKDEDAVEVVVANATPVEMRGWLGIGS